MTYGQHGSGKIVFF